MPITIGLALLLALALRPTSTAPSAAPVHRQSGRIELLSVVRLPLQSVLLDPATSNLVHNLSALGLTPAATVTFVSGNGTTGSDGSLGFFWSSAGVSYTST
ncbi:MAG: hypothetical protein HYY85_04220, partial [Deltaproteobacteria bacterium]|nr:hypothetical protein [Deltaproteobacteria bacterium]